MNFVLFGMRDETFEKSVAKRCESCGAEFSCGAENERCWCFALDLSAETLAQLPADFKNCLCKDCLLNYGKKEK